MAAAAVPAAAATARALLDAATIHCAESILSILRVTELLICPRTQFPVLAEDLPHASALDTSESEDEWGPGGDAPPAAELPTSARIASSLAMPTNSWWDLRFKDPAQEERFRRRHNLLLLQFDVLSYIFLVFCINFIMFYPGTFHLASKLDRFSIALSTVCFLPAALLVTPRGRAVYGRHREPLLAFTFLAVTGWEVHVQHYMHLVDPVVFTRPLYMHGFSWLGTMLILFQLRHVVLAPLAAACFAADATLMPTICRHFYPDQDLGQCVAKDLVAKAALEVLGPLLVVGFFERHARMVFAARVRDAAR